MRSGKEEIASGRDFYAEIYAADLDGQAKWLEFGAKEKADSIDLLTRHAGVKPLTLLELGCGTGAVIKECARRNLASRYVAVDYVSDAVERLRREAPRIECMTADIADAGFHLLDEAGFAVAGERWFVPEMSPESIRFVCKKDGFGKIRTLYTLLTLCYLARLLRPAWKRYWYSHLAVRCSLKNHHRGAGSSPCGF